MLNWMGASRDVELAVSPINDEWCIPDDRVAHTPRLHVERAVIEVDPSKIVLVHPHHYKFLNVALVVARQRRFKVDRSDFVFSEPLSDDLVSLLASEHCAGCLTVELSGARADV